MRFSKAYIPTSKETPNDAVLPSHIYLSRAGFISQVASGLYNFLPLGHKVINNIKTIVNEEMENIGAQEVNLSFATPASLWEESGRLEKFGKELLRFQDRKENDFVLAPTHEEMMVNLVRHEITSYKQLPMNLYQITSKFRDEARPRFGLMRGREFLMKDGYSFHASHEDMVREFDEVEAAYKRIITRLGLEFRVVEADSGAIGGSGSKEIMVIADSGEDTIAICSSCEYGANVEAAKREKLSNPDSKGISKVATVSTPNIKTIKELEDFFKIDSFHMIKAVVKEALYDEGSEIVVFFLRGCDELQEVKACNSVGANELVDVDADKLTELGFAVGFMGPKECGDLKVIYDIELEDAQEMICGANEVDKHITGFSMGVIKGVTFDDVAQVREGDACPHCGEEMRYTKGIECGHIFQLGTTYSKPLGANFLDENGKSQDIEMGTYGLGVSRLVAAVIEQHHDEKGCQWTLSTAPYQVNVMVSNIKDEEQLAFGEKLYSELKVNGISTIIDDRKERFGFKIKDAELIGFPFTVIIGKTLAEGSVEILDRQNDKKIAVTIDALLSKLLELVKG
jgi:prolyl-tRNA synthetase